MTAMPLRAPFPYFGGKRTIAEVVWSRLGRPKQYIEPFCGSAAVLLAAPQPASLEVVGDTNGFIANFWRAVKHQPEAVAREADYPVSHVDLGARHAWLLTQRDRLGAELQDPHWPGDAHVAGWWLWGQCCWIGAGWCEWTAPDGAHADREGNGQIPHLSNAGMGIQARGRIPHLSDAGMGTLTSGGATAFEWLGTLAERLERVRVVHGDWERCLNAHHGRHNDGVGAVFLDPPYRDFEAPYGSEATIADAVAAWAKENADLRIALCGHEGDYDLPGWDCERWTRRDLTYGSTKTRDKEAIWFSPACLSKQKQRQGSLFDAAVLDVAAPSAPEEDDLDE